MAQSGPTLTYRIDNANRIIALGDGWTAFANSNACFSLTPSRVIGTPLTSWVSDATTREVYDALLARIRQHSDAVSFRFRCDGPAVRRLLQMRIASERNGEVEFCTTLVESQPRTAMSLMDATLIRTDAEVKMCGWCMRVPDASGQWLEIEQAVQSLRLFEGLPIPRLSHTMCPSCYASMENTLDRAGTSQLEAITFGALPS